MSEGFTLGFHSQTLRLRCVRLAFTAQGFNLSSCPDDAAGRQAKLPDPIVKLIFGDHGLPDLAFDLKRATASLNGNAVNLLRQGFQAIFLSTWTTGLIWIG